MNLTQAQVAAIEALQNEDGQITPHQVLEAARDTDSPLHALFNWNREAAAEKWWLHPAREIIGAVTIQVTHQHSVVKAPCYVVDTSVKGQGYRSVTALKGDTHSARESLIYTLNVAAGHLRRAYDLAGPLGLEAEINGLVQQITGLQRRAGKKAA